MENLIYNFSWISQSMLNFVLSNHLQKYQRRYMKKKNCPPLLNFNKKKKKNGRGEKKSERGVLGRVLQ